MKTVKDKRTYNQPYVRDKAKLSLALEKALDTRKFEIDLYWKRATYFWTFIAATLTGYGLTSTMKFVTLDEQISLNRFQFVIICLGMVFSFGWYLVNKGSKYWQINWEKHVSVLEDDIIGPLFKRTWNLNLNDEKVGESISFDQFKNILEPTSETQISVTKINQMVSVFVLILWILICVFFLCEHYTFSLKDCDVFVTLFLILVIVIFVTLINTTQTKIEDSNYDFRQVTIN